jgi:quercetin dioxygenase-like cupin family protein
MTFMPSSGVETTEFEWGSIGWLARPDNVPECTGMCALDVRLDPGQGHDFHTHPDQEEMIILKSGSVEQWIEGKKMRLNAGDACFVPKNTVHGTFVDEDADEPALIIVVLSPSHGDEGYYAHDVSTEEPWASIRS